MSTILLGGTASDVVVSKTGHGLMMLTMKSPITPDNEAFAAIKVGIDSLPPGAKMLLSAGEFYGPGFDVDNLELLARFFDRYPECADKTILAVKGGCTYHTPDPDASPANLRRSVDLINATLRGTKRLDLFQPARVDPNVPVEHYMRTLERLRLEGKFDHVGISECNASTLRKANAVHPIAAVEIEVSPLFYEEEAKRVINVAAQLRIPVIAYAPLGRGFMTSHVRRNADLGRRDFRRHLTRFQDETIDHNKVIVQAFMAIAREKNITPAQLSIAWVSSLGRHVLPIPGSSSWAHNVENLHGGRLRLLNAEKAQLDIIVHDFRVRGDRYFGAPAADMNLWG